QFVLMSGSGDTQYSPFAVVNGQVFISDAFIQDGSVGNLKIGNYIQSNTWDGTGNVGWHINKSGYAVFNGVTVRGTLIATNGQFSFTGNSGVLINANGVTVNLANGGRIVLGAF
ncbi:host specificity protein, partial [Phytobacter ursingii]